MGSIKGKETEIIAKYLDKTQKHTTTSLGKEYNVSDECIRCLLRKNGIKSKTLHINHSFFSNITTEKQAYWLGFLFAEGHLEVKRNCLGLRLGQDELKTIENFKTDIESEHKICRDSKNGAWYVKMSSPQITKDLQRYEFGGKKSGKIKLPKLSNKLIQHFIRGYFDGDGWITLNNKTNSHVVCGFASCSSLMIKELQNFLVKNKIIHKTKIVKRYRKNKNPNHNDFYCLHICGLEVVFSMYNFLYNNATVFMPRKKERFEQIFQNCELSTYWINRGLTREKITSFV